MLANAYHSCLIGFILSLVSYQVFSLHIVQVPQQDVVNNRPIIGILSQEPSNTVNGLYPENHTSLIAASYVKFLEGAGARVVPIPIKKDKEFYDNLLNKLNGVLLPGGAAYFNNTLGYSDAGDAIFSRAKELNDAGQYFPVWGTCLGFELLAYLAASKVEPRVNCQSQNVSMPLRFRPDYFDSKLFKEIPNNILDILSSQNVTANFHSFCVTEEKLESLGLDLEWHVLSVNEDDNGLEFISSFESRTYPFYGVQFHPEKNGYEFKKSKNIPHSAEAIEVMQYFANFFVAEARKSDHTFPSLAAEQAALIYNYPVTFTGDHLSFEQVYFFDYEKSN